METILQTTIICSLYKLLRAVTSTVTDSIMELRGRGGEEKAIRKLLNLKNLLIIDRFKITLLLLHCFVSSRQFTVPLAIIILSL